MTQSRVNFFGMQFAGGYKVMITETISPENSREWDSFVASHPDSNCYHLRAWQVVAQSAYHIQAPFLLARTQIDAPVCGVLPLFSVRGLMNNHMTNGLFGAYGSVLATNEDAKRALLEQAIILFEETGLKHFMIKCLFEIPFHEELGLKRSDSWVIATLKLDSDPDKIWHGLRDKIRNCVRKAQRYNLEIRTGDDQLTAFYDVLAENMHHKGSPIYGLQFMKELLASLEGRGEIITLWQKDHAVAGAFLIHHAKTTTVPFASSRPSALSMCPNNLLYWEIIRRSCLRGMAVLDFGRSMKDSGPLAFKLGWGAVTQPHPAYLKSSLGHSLEINIKDRRVDWFVKQWKKLPRPVVNAVGPAVCRRLAGLI